MSTLRETTFVKYFLYGTGAVVLSELGYQFFLWWRNRLADKRASADRVREINDVIWINELTTDCMPRGAEKSIHDNKKCKNIFCYPRNIGKIIALIDSAQHTVDLSMYIFTSTELSRAIHRALARGLDIRVISDPEMVYSSGSQITSLKIAEVPVRLPKATNMLMHHKFCIIDGPARSRAVSQSKQQPYVEQRGILFSGSLNWTHAGFNNNWENIIITSNSVLVKKFEEEFQRMWEAFEPFSQQM